MTHITIIGGGVSGVFLAIQIMRSKTDLPLTITLVEKENEPWLGVAYSTDKPFHLLNVRASRMSALQGEDDHFLDWLHQHNYDIAANDFAPRLVFRKYVEDVLQTTLHEKPANVELTWLRNSVIDIKQINEHEAAIYLNDGQQFVSNLIVLALGNFTTHSPLTQDPALAGNDAYYDNPWAWNIFDDLKNDARVVILGTGPTMIDTVLTLHHQEHKGQIIALSRHGLIPAKHLLSEPYPDFSNEMKDITSLTEAVMIVRKHIAIAEKNGIGWRAVIDAMRPFTQNFWINFTLRAKRDFLKYYKTFWEVSRSRMPEECATIIEKMIDERSLVVIPGRVTKFERHGAGIKVSFSNTKTREKDLLIADTVINCMGPGLNFEKIKDPLVESLVKQGLICNSAASVGINALPDGTIIKKDGSPSEIMFTLGSLLRGILWETIAIPEIRMQAQQLAALIIQKTAATITKINS